MGVFNSPDIFQERISKLFEVLDMVSAYIDDVLVITENNFKDHLKALNIVVRGSGVKSKCRKSFFERIKFEYLGFWVINNEVIPLSSKVEAIKSISVPTNVRNVQKFVGLVNDHRYMWRKREYALAPLTKLC